MDIPVYLQLDILLNITNSDIEGVMHDIRTINQLVSALGGDTALSAQLGVCQEAVANWKQRGVIPGGWHLRLYAECVAKGKTVDPRVFGLTERDIQPLTVVTKKKRGKSLRAPASA